MANNSSRERKSPPFADCCKTSAPPATNARSIRLWAAAIVQLAAAKRPLAQSHSLKRLAIVSQLPSRPPDRDNSEKFVPRSAAGSQSPQMAGKTAHKAFRPEHDKPRQPCRSPRVAKSQHQE